MHECEICFQKEWFLIYANILEQLGDSHNNVVGESATTDLCACCSHFGVDTCTQMLNVWMYMENIYFTDLNTEIIRNPHQSKIST
jgi:hypothetical protein